MQYEVYVVALILFFFLLVILLLWICRERLRKSEISSLQHQESTTTHSPEENEK